jgi:hypothetical protein
LCFYRKNHNGAVAIENNDERRESCSYLLRFWREPAEGARAWRISIEEPLTGERRGFTGLGDLFNYLFQVLCGDSNERDETA